jgi:hypothetical protein
METPTPSPQTQTWITAITGIAAALGAVLAKKRFTRKSHSTLSPQPSTAVALAALTAKLDGNHKEILSAVAAQSTAIEKRLDNLEATMARLDERTKILSTFGASELAVPILHAAGPSPTL